MAIVQEPTGFDRTQVAPDNNLAITLGFITIASIDFGTGLVVD